MKEGWAIDVTSSNHNHYYKDGVSLCKKKRAKDYFKYDKTKTFSPVLGFTCTLCEKQAKKLFHT